MHKSFALAQCIEHGVSHMWTVSALQMHPRSCIVCDEDATMELRVKTVKYFKGIQETMVSALFCGVDVAGNPPPSRVSCRPTC